MSTETVPIHFVHRLLGTAERRGVDVSTLLRQAGIPGDIAYNPRARVTVEQLSRVTQQLWNLTDDELFGIAAQPLPRGTFRMVALALIHAPDLRSVLARFVEFTTVIPGCPSCSVETSGSTTRVSIDVTSLDDPLHLATDLLVAIAHRLVGWLIGKRIPLRSVELPYAAPPEAPDYDSIFGRMPTFGTGVTAITFDSALLDSPVIRDEAALLEYIRQSPSELFTTRDYGSTTSDQVRPMLEQGLRGDWPSQEEIAARRSVSVQHLRRLLREEGTSVSQLKEDILRDAAIASLARGEESVEDLAVRLGFSEASAFRRAFRRWTGSPPGAYRMSD